MKPVRSVLSVPGHIPYMHEKACLSKADVVMLDLEDSVPPDQKIQARNQVIQSVTTLNWQGKTLAIRINSLDTPFGVKDAFHVAENAHGLADFVVLPKVNDAGDIHFLDRLLSGIDLEKGSDRPMRIEAAIETAQGLDQVSDIARASERLRSLSFGVADYSASVNAGLASISGHGENESQIYPGHRWHYPISRIIMAAKANGLLAIDAPFGNFRDKSGLETSAAMSKALGCDGKWAIHPDQLNTINQIFSPSDKEIARAKKILNAAERHPVGAVAVDGKMVDLATIRLAKRVWDQAVFLGIVKE